MKIINEKITKETIIDQCRYYAFDGTEFSSIYKCAQYDLDNKYFPNNASWCKINSSQEFADVAELLAIKHNLRDYYTYYTVDLNEERVSELVKNDKGLDVYEQFGNHTVIKQTYNKILTDRQFPIIIKYSLGDGDYDTDLQFYTIDYYKKELQKEIDDLSIELNNLSNIEHEFNRDEIENAYK